MGLQDATAGPRRFDPEAARREQLRVIQQEHGANKTAQEYLDKTYAGDGSFKGKQIIKQSPGGVGFTTNAIEEYLLVSEVQTSAGKVTTKKNWWAFGMCTADLSITHKSAPSDRLRRARDVRSKGIQTAIS